MSVKQSSGMAARRRHKTNVRGPAPTVRKPVKKIGRLAHKHYDPVTGRRLAASAR